MTAYTWAAHVEVLFRLILGKRMSPPNRQDVPQISKELGIHQSTLYKWCRNWRLQREVLPASEKDPDSWSVADKFTVVLETAGFICRTGRPLAPNSTGCKCKRIANHGGAKGA